MIWVFLCDRCTEFLAPYLAPSSGSPGGEAKEGVRAVRLDDERSQVVCQAPNDYGVLIPSYL